MEDCYGPELILDLFECDVATFGRKSLRAFCKAICEEIGMTPHLFRFVPWDDDGVAPDECQTKPETKGYTAWAIQFLMESSVLIHTLELKKLAMLNIFSCKNFDRKKATQFTKDWFGAEKVTSRLIRRG